MTITDDQLDAFAELANAIGLMQDGQPNTGWFTDPVGDARDASFTPGLSTMLADDQQREALISFVDDVLGPPSRTTDDDEIWVPLFKESSPIVTIHAVLTQRPGSVWLGIGVEYETGLDAPRVATKIHVPIFQLRRRNGELDLGDEATPEWLLLGGPDGNVSISLDATLDDGTPPPGEAGLGGLELSLQIPTSASGTIAFGLVLHRLQLPGASAPADFDLSIGELDEIGSEILDLVVGLVRAQADALDLSADAARPFAALTGLTGIRSVPGLPQLPLADLAEHGVDTVVNWIGDVLSDSTATDAWLGELADLIGGTVDAARDAVVFAIGPAELLLGVRIDTGVTGLPILTPWIDVGLVTDAARGRVGASADILRLDVATGDITALPTVQASAVFGVDAGAPPVLTGDPGCDSVRIGIDLREGTSTRAVVALGGVTVGGTVHPVVDLTSPNDALDVVNDVIDAALVDALAALGPAGELVATLVGLDPPTGVDGTDATGLIADPFGALADYWADLVTDPDAMVEVLSEFGQLLGMDSSVAVDGSGTRSDPWLVGLAGPVELAVFSADGAVCGDLVVTSTRSVMDDHQVVTSLRVGLLCARLALPSLDLLTSATADMRLERVDGTPLVIAAHDVSVEADSVAATIVWRPNRGVRFGVSAPGAVLRTTAGSMPGLAVDLPLPSWNDDGELVFEPDWRDVEDAIAALFGALDLPIADTLIDLVGWRGDGPRLDLGLLVSAPDLAIRTWAADIVLDCDRIHDVLLPISSLFNGLRGARLVGIGTAADPLRCPVGASVNAPGLAVWTQPPCPPPPGLNQLGGKLLGGAPMDAAEMVAALHDAASLVPSIADLLVGRDGLDTGLELLVERWSGSDGLVVRPESFPTGVAVRELAEVSYADMVVMGRSGELPFELFETAPDGVVHVGVESAWSMPADRPGGAAVTVIDASDPATSAVPTRLASAASGSGDDEWFVRLPDRATADGVRGDRDATAEQAARLVDLFADRVDPCTVIAYGQAGAAAIRAAATTGAIAQVVTVGTPWGALSVDSMATGSGGDALRLLHVLGVSTTDQETAGGEEGDGASDDVERPGRRLALVVDRAEAALSLLGRPASAAGEAIRSGLAVTAAFGVLSTDTIEAELAELLGTAVESRRAALVAATADPGPVTSLHAGVSIPPVDLDIGGLLIGAGVTVEACRIERDSSGGIATRLARGIHLRLRLGVHDGWLVGGPGGLQHDLEVRWMEARVHVPLDGSTGRTDLTLHEATTFGVFRERWEVGPDDADADAALSVVLPELRALMSSVVARLNDVAGDVADLLGSLGIVRDGGLDPASFDRWIYDTAAAASDALAAGGAEVAAAIRALIGDTTSTGTSLSWSQDGSQVTVDLATGVLSGIVTTAEPGAASLDVRLDVSPTGASLTVGAGVGDDLGGGVRLAASASTGAAPALSVDVVHPGGTIEQLSLLSPPDPTAVARRLSEVAAGVIGAGLGGRLVDHLRAAASDAASETVDQVLDLLGLLGTASATGARSARVPLALFVDPVAHVRHGVEALRTAFAPSVVSLLDAVGGAVADTGTAGSWTLSDECSIRYSLEGSGVRVHVAYDDEHTIGAASVITSFAAGLIIGRDAPPVPSVDTAIAIDGRGARLLVDPQLRVDLVRPSPLLPITLYPLGGSIGDTVADVGGMVAPLILNELIGHRDDGGSSALVDVATVVFDVGEALDLVETAPGSGEREFSEARIVAFAADPAAALVARLPQLAASGLEALADALDPGGTLVRSTSPGPGLTRFDFGTGDGASFVLDASGPTPAIELGCDVTIPGVGIVAVDRLRLSTAGVQVAARFGPAEIEVGPVTIRPLVVVQAGVTDAGFSSLVGVGLASDATGDSSVEFRWGLDGQPPELVLVDRTGPELGTVLDDPAGAALELLGFAISLAGSMLVEALDDLLTDEVTDWLRGVVFETGTGDPVIDSTVFADLLDPAALFDRLLTFAWNVVTSGSPPSLTIAETVTIALTSAGSSGDKRLGINLSLVPDKPFPMATGDVSADLVVNSTWIDRDVDPGLTIELLRGSRTNLRFAPAVIAAGIGVRVSKNAGALIDLGGVAIDAIAVHTYGEATSDGEVGGGVELQFDGLAFSPSAGGGDNAVANSIMNDAGDAGEANRPSLSPALSVQIAPGADDPSISVRLDDPPGPWWVIVQRQLGPLYIERVGLDTLESGGVVQRVSLLFDGRLSILGLTAAVDQLSLNWHGGDILAIGSWSVDLQGLAVSAEMSGMFLSGGLLKTTDDGQVSYVGMLMGRFGVYGLSVFGGYTEDDGSPSFFVFGALNGPIGGPPAFFVTGIGGGLGINRGLRTPDDLSQLDEYPFIKALDPGASASDDPMGELRDLAAYFPPESGNFWFAAGISFTSFALVDGVAVVAVSFGNGLDVNLFGLARMALPRPEVALVSIELAIMARFSTSEGLFIIQAQLTDNSWLLYPEVRLTGGFAMAMWWKGPLAGQFVLSLGGYHPDFHRDGYPVVPRLGLEWRISDAIVIKGGSYFALTSEALMAGVDVEVSADWGWAWVRVAFGAHAIVYFDPFFYMASAYARISAGIKINVFFGTIRISISIGASIEVQGPKFSGTASFEIGPCDLSVSFGDRHKEAAPPIQWAAFTEKFLEVGSSGNARALSAVTGRGTLPSATDGDTSAPTADGTVDRPFEVFAESEIVFVTTVPVEEFSIGTQGAVETHAKKSNTRVDLGAAPMGVDRLQSTVSIRLQRKVGSTWQDVDSTIINALREGLAEASVDVATPHVRTDAFPVGVWGQTQDEVDKPMPKGDVVVAGSVVKLVAGMFVEQVGPEIDYRKVEAGRRPLPLSAAGAARDLLRSTSDGIFVVNPATPVEALSAAKALVFADAAVGAAAGGGVAGVVARGAHSERARRSFAGSRTAPPLFGTLAGGIGASNGDRATTELLDARPATEARATRPPVVIGHLAAGAGAALRSTATTVADGRTKRRSAPTLDSVNGRLGNELPLRLDRRTPPAVQQDGVLLATSYPHTDLAGAVSTRVGGRVGSPHLARLVGGLPVSQASGPRGRNRPLADDTRSAIRSGDIVVLEQTDVDIDVGSKRPTLHLEGAARVVMLRPGGTVAHDRNETGDVVVPRGVALVAVQADPSPMGDKSAGWHGRTRLARLGARSGIGPGCVVCSDALDARRRTGWVSAHDMVASATSVTTHFADAADYVVIVLESGRRVDLDALSVVFHRCRRATDAQGVDRPPTVVLSGSQSLTFVPIELDDDDDPTGFAVTVQRGGGHRLGGVLAGTMPMGEAADLAAERGVDALAGRLLATSGPGCTIDWQHPNPTGPASSPKRSAAPKRSASKKRAAPKKQAVTKKAAPKKKQAAATKKAAPNTTRSATPRAAKRTTARKGR